MPATLSPTLAFRIARLSGALREYAYDPFAASLAERLDEVLVAADARLAALELLGPPDLVGIERLRPADEARETLADVVSGDPVATTAADASAPLPLRLQPVLWALVALGAFWLGWLVRGLTAAPR